MVYTGEAEPETKRLREEVGSLKAQLEKLQGSNSPAGKPGYLAQNGSQPYQNENIMARYQQAAQGNQINAYQMLARAFTGMYAMMAEAYKQVANAAREMRALYQGMEGQPAYAGIPGGNYGSGLPGRNYTGDSQKTGKVN